MKKYLFIFGILSLINACNLSSNVGNTTDKNSNIKPLAPAVLLIATKCTFCHSQAPTQGNGGILFDTPEQIISRAAQIKQAVFISRKMPRPPVTLTEEERIMIGRWADQQ